MRLTASGKSSVQAGLGLHQCKILVTGMYAKSAHKRVLEK